jgi:hypothetical protein
MKKILSSGGVYWIRTNDTLLRYAFLAGKCLRPTRPTLQTGGSGEIRTHGTFLFAGFQDQCLKPLGHASINAVHNPFPIVVQKKLKPIYLQYLHEKSFGVHAVFYYYTLVND